ncbi:hypothetical protein [Paenibacillus sp. FSL R7-0128]|uniref:hypothetical protein n=1 Tax=Paenibacillus sp. FSL R7-0128 TaxID=2954529 RepID=UPI0030FC7AD3
MKRIIFTVELTYDDEEAAGYSPADRVSAWLFNEEYAREWDVMTMSDEEVGADDEEDAS